MRRGCGASGVALGILLGVLATPVPAAACTCAKGPSQSFPGEGQRAPRNTKVWVTNDHLRLVLGQHKPTSEDVSRAMRLASANGQELAYDVTELKRVDWGTWFFVVTPKRELEPGEYRFGLPGKDPKHEDFEHALVHFQVVDERWLEPPPLPEVRSKSYQVSDEGMCGVAEYVGFDIEYRGSVLVTALEDRRGEIATTGQTFAGVSIGEGAFVGHTSCAGNWEFDDGPAVAQFGVFDLAGNFSGWSRPELVERAPSEPPKTRPPPLLRNSACACHAVPSGTTSPWLAAAWLFTCSAALAIRRRSATLGL